MINLINNPQSEIRNPKSESGFSLTEVLIAIGLLAVGMLFIAGSFPVSIHFTTIATERTIAPIVADEAFAKLRLYGPDFNDVNIPDAEYAYPSTPTDPNYKQYWWSFIYNYTDHNDIIVYVFRKAGASSEYFVRKSDSDPTLVKFPHPTLIYIGIGPSPTSRPDELAIRDMDPTLPTDEFAFINDGYTIVDADSRNIYRVMERYSTSPNVIRLEKDWVGTFSSNPMVWVASPSVNGGRYPCIGVYRKRLRF
jgi:prepilin-type N-terminal cleavage/methylation domain-containing protein